MAQPLIYQAAATTAEPATSPDDGGSLAPESLPADPTTIDIEQLMDLPVRAAPRQDPADALKDREAQAAGNDVPRDDELPADITTMSLDSLMNLRVRTVQQEEEDKKDKKDDKDQTDPENNGEDAGEAQQIAADDPAAAGDGQNGEGEAAQGDGDGTGNGDGTGDGTGDGGSDGADPAPPQSSGSDGGESSAASLGQAIQVLPTELVYAAALQSGDLVHSAPAPQPVAAAPIFIQQVAASAPPPNAAPLAKGDAAATAAHTAMTVSVLANDSDLEGSPLHVTAVTQGGNGSVAINPDGTLTYVPNAGFSGIDKFTYTISDGNGGTSSAAVSVTVAPPLPPVNVAPVAQNDQAATSEDAAVIINVLGNDTDADGDPLFVSAVTQGANGQVAINTDGTLTYTPQADFFGVDTFSYTISDGRGGTSTATVSLVVKPVNDAPVATDDAARTDQGQPVTFAVLANDSDPDGGTLSVTSVTSGTNGKVAINADGTLTYYPASGFAGTDSFTYTVSDGQGGSAQATVSVVVNHVNAPPVAAADAVSTNEDVPLVIAAAALLANDSDADLDALSITGFTQGANGRVADNGNGTFTYTPNANYSGTDAFTYTVSDGQGGTDVATVTVTVNAINDAPVAAADAVSTNEDAAVIINVLGNDTDADGDPLFVSAVTQGQHGQVAINADGTLTYTPEADFFGADSFSYTISDGRGGTSTATVTLVVKPVNDAPVAADDAAQTDQGQPVTFAVLANDSDPDGDTLTVTSVTSSTNGKVAINADGTLTYFPAAGFAGTDSFTYTVSDGQGGSAQATVSVVVNHVNAPSVATDSVAAMEAGTPISGMLTAADSDHAPADLRFSLATAPANGTVVVQADGTYTYTPASGFIGTDTFAFTVADPTGASANASVTVSVLPSAAGNGAGGEFIVNTTTVGAQQVPAMAALKDGGFVIAWESQSQDGSGFGIFAQRYDAHGTAVGGEFRANTFVLNHQQLPSVAALADGGFVLVWQSQNQDGNNLGVFGMRFDANGQAVGSEFRVNTFVLGAQAAPDVAALADGGFVVAWESQNQDGNNNGVFAQRFDANGLRVGREFQVNTFTQNAQQTPDVTALSDGGFVIVWESQNQDGNNAGVFGQRFDANGLRVGGEFQVNTFTQNAQQAPEVAALAGGGFVVVWESQNQDGNNFGIFGQRYAADGARLGGEFQVNTTTAGSQQAASVTALADGSFTVVWQSNGQDGSGFGIYGRHYDANGLAVGQEFQVNVFTTGAQGAPDVAVLADGSLAVSWQSAGQDGASEGIIARVVEGSAPTGHSFTGGSGNDSFIGGSLADTLSGAAGNDRLEGALGADQLFGGSGDDILLWDPADAVIDGGAGNDTLQVNGGDVDLPSFASKIGGLEVIDLATDTAANHLTLNVQDILDISDTDVLTVLGDARDSVDAGAGWTQAGADGQGHDIYTQIVGGVVATLIVDSDITLNADLLL